MRWDIRIFPSISHLSQGAGHSLPPACLPFSLSEPSFTVPRPPQFTPICHGIIYLTAASRAKLVTRVSSGDSSQHGRRHASKD